MPASDLHLLLTRLHDELAGGPELDEESRRLLGVVLADIGRLPVSEPAHAAVHVPTLERLAVRFESDHPAVAAAARALVDSLAKAGI